MTSQFDNKMRLRRQWYIGPIISNIGNDWKSLQISLGYSLFYHKDQRVNFKLINNGGIIIIGFAFNPKNINSNPLIELANSIDKKESIENIIITLGGTYAIIIFLEKSIKIFNDPSGIMGVYFTRERAASTPTLLPPLVRNSKIDKDFKFGPGNDWYTGSTTPFVGIRKLIPNCSLDFTSSTIKRYWPENDEININYSGTEIIFDKLVYLFKGMMAGVALQGKILCSLTGGQDSRVALAASKDYWDKFSFFTLKGDSIQKDDILYASMLANKAKISHHLYDIIPNQKWLDGLYNEIGAGESIGTRREIASTCLQLEGSETIHVNGNLGALCKSYYWHNKHPSVFKFSALARDFTNPGKITINGITEWKKTVSNIVDPVVLYNLFYLEQRGGRWISAGENCSRLFYESFTPFNHREIFSLICSLPLNIQYGGLVLKELVTRMAPELSSVPYCKAYRNWSKYIPGRVKKGIKNFMRIVK